MAKKGELRRTAADLFITAPELEVTKATYTPDEEELAAIKEYEATPPEQRPRAEKVERRGRPKSTKEIKDARQQLVLTRTLADAMAARAAELGLSKNEYIEQLIKADLKRKIIKTED